LTSQVLIPVGLICSCDTGHRRQKRGNGQQECFQQKWVRQVGATVEVDIKKWKSVEVSYVKDLWL
jgi:chloramphenicol 3-O-phosphotransferase